MTKQTKKSVVKTTKKQAVQETKVVEQKWQVPNCSVNFLVVTDFDGFAKKYSLTKDSTVNQIMLSLYKEFGTNLNQNTTAKQIRDFKGEGCKCSASCISWYKNHYNAELNKFVSTKNKGNTKQEILDKLYGVEELKPVQHLLPTISLTKLNELVTKYELA